MQQIIFERTSNVKKAMGLGPENTAIPILHLAEKTEIKLPGQTPFFGHKKLSPSHVILALLGIEAKELPVDKYFLIEEYWNPKTGKLRKKYISLISFKEKWLRYRGNIYYIP